MKRILSLVLVSLVLLTLLVGFASAPVLAAGAVEFYPTTGAAGEQVTVTGTGFVNGETVVVKFGNTQVATGVVNDPTGFWSTTFLVPSSAVVGSSYTVTATGSPTTGTVAASYSFVVAAKAAITINTSQGPVGTSVTVSGTGFAASERDIKVTFGGVQVGTSQTANSSGAWTSTFTVPAAPSGSHSIDASGRTTPASSVAEVVFTVEPSIAVKPNTGSAGTSVTVTGTGFAANESGIRATFDGSPVGPSVKANDKGGWTASFTIPATSGGEHVIDASGTSTQAAGVPDVTFSTGSSISINKNSGSAGTSVTVTGTGFAANEPVSITWDGNPLGTATAGPQGSWTATVTIPESTAGVHKIDAFGPSTQAGSIADATFTTSGGIDISPRNGSPGTGVTVNGYGFAANEKNIQITYDGAVVASGITADPQGVWTGTFTVPASSAGSHQVGAYGTSTRVNSIGSVPFVIGAGISLAKTSGSPGSTVTVNGFGFAANEKNIVVTFDGVEVASNIAANAQGAWSTSFAVPPSMSGDHVIDAYGAATTASRIGDLSFSTTAGISVTPASGSVGSKVVITGFGFEANVPVEIKYDNSDIGGAAGTDASGEINHTITIPPSTAGRHSIRVVDPHNNEYKFDFAVESVPPSQPRLLSPEDGSSAGFFKGSDITFKWVGVSDPSGVSYILQVNNDPDFSQPLLEKSGLNGTSYSPTASETFKEGTYYWRVKAVDGASNESEWSQTFVVKPGTMAIWALVLIILAALLVIVAGIYIFLIRRKSKPAAVESGPSPFPVPGIDRVEAIPGQWRPLEPELSAKPRALPFRLALPQAPKTPSRNVSPEDQARLKVIANFVQSLPLVETSYEPGWLLDLAESSLNAPLTPADHTRILEGSFLLRYDPAWMRHPLYEDMSVLLRDQPIMQNLRSFIDTVNLCASESGQLLREIFADTKVEIAPDILKSSDWEFVSAVYTDAMNWFLGKSLMDPSERDYTAKNDAGTGEEGAPVMWLWGSEATSFAHPLIPATNEGEFARFRSVHLKLRRSYRSSNRARQVASLLTQLEVQRSRLSSSFSQLASAMQ